MTPLMKQELREEGFVEIHNVDKSTLDVANQLGCVTSLLGRNEVDSLLVREKEQANQHSYTENFGTGYFPLHTDLAQCFMPPRYILLRPIVGDPAIETLIVGHKRVFDYVSKEIASKALFSSRKRILGRMCLLRSYHQFSGTEIFRWDSVFLVPQNKEADSLSVAMKEFEKSGAERTVRLTDSRSSCQKLWN